MLLNTFKADVWAASLEDRSGAIAEKLEGLARAGANIEFIVSRRTPDKPGKGVLFLTPLKGDAQIAEARKQGFTRTDGLHSLRVEGPDEPGMGYLITRALAGEGINLHGISAAVLGNRFVMYLAFDTTADADKAAKRLAAPL